MSPQDRLDAAIESAQALLDLMKTSPSMATAEAFRDAATDVCVREAEKDKDPYLLAKEMNP